MNAESVLKASTYPFGTRVLIAYEEAETGVVLLINPMPRNEMFSRSVDSRTPVVPIV